MGGWWSKVPPMNEVSHFENLQSTNWNTLRFKSPPSTDSDIGWRVEFRPLDIQLTDYENAALTVFVGMLVNIINEFSLDFIMPISLVDQNMLECQVMDALLTSKFWFRVDLFDHGVYTRNDLAENKFAKSSATKTTALRELRQLYIW